jgi:hypothetical protein
VVANVKTAQVRQLRSAGGVGGLCIRLLGPLTIVNDGKPVAVASKKARALIGYLALREGAAIPRRDPAQYPHRPSVGRAQRGAGAR